MASQLVPKSWTGSSLVTPARFLEYFGSHKSVPRITPRVVLVDSPGLITKLAEQAGTESANALGLKWLNVGNLTVVCANGFSAAAAAFALEVLAELGAEDVISLGTAAGLQPKLQPGDLLVADAAYRDDGVSL